MTEFFRLLVHKYPWVHLSLGLFGNTAFVVGSVMLLPSLAGWETVAAWLFIVGSFFMLVGALGQLLVNVLKETPAVPK